ncbi:MAG: hypothetical protein Q4B26_20915 [Eubacteriales bacterium]|nr:hypothetical protein [Eubacteriales bacterium]
MLSGGNTYSWHYTLDENITLCGENASDKLSAFDQKIYLAMENFWKDGKNEVFMHDLYAHVTGNPVTSLTAEQIQKITNSLYKLGRVTVVITWTPESRMKKTKDIQELLEVGKARRRKIQSVVIEGRLLNTKILTIETVQGVVIKRIGMFEPILYTYKVAQSATPNDDKKEK